MPLQHKVSFIEAVKVLDMKMMAQIFEKEVSGRTSLGFSTPDEF